MKIEIIFKINKEILLDLAKILNINFSKKQLLDDAERNLALVKNQWDVNKKTLIELLDKYFSDSISIKKIKIIVNIVPQYYYVGASNTQKDLIVFGQPLRTNNFSSAIIIHEISHIFLSKIKSERPIMVDEIICFMLEDYIYSIFDKKSLIDVWKEGELGLFHATAMKNAISDMKKNKLIISRDVSEIISNLIKNLDNASLFLKPRKGLIKNINISNKRIGVS